MRFLLSAFCLLIAVSMYSATANAELIGFLDFEGNTNDVMGHSVAGSISGFLPGHEGQAGDFDGIGNVLQWDIDVSPGLMPEMTFGAWAKTDSLTGLRAIMSADDNNPSNFDRHIGMDTRGSSGATTYSAFIGDGGAGVLSVGEALTSDFTFVAARYDGTDVTLWVDGSQITGLDSTAGDPVHHDELWIGKNPFHDSFFDGTIDNAFVFDEALSDTQVNDIRTGGSAAILALSAIPEPSNVLLLAIPMLGLIIRRSRRS